MNVSKPCVCCENCLELIGRQNTKMASNWVQLVEKSDFYPVVKADHDVYEKHLLPLERMQFITSTDDGECVLVRLIGKQYEAQGDYFFVCGGRCGS